LTITSAEFALDGDELVSVCSVPPVRYVGLRHMGDGTLRNQPQCPECRARRRRPASRCSAPRRWPRDGPGSADRVGAGQDGARPLAPAQDLRLIALGAPDFIIADSQRLLDRSVAETGLTEATLAKIDPKYRLNALGLDALAAAEDDRPNWQSYDDPDETPLEPPTPSQ
jgi:hypothetical protein